MNYHWTDCPGCGCQIAINWSARADGTSGSVRRWSADRSVNDGRPFVLPPSPEPAAVLCVCGATLALPGKPDAVGGERSENMRVTLNTGD